MSSNSDFRPGTFGKLITSENSSFSPFGEFINLDSSTEESTSSSLGEYSAEMAEIHETYLSSPAAKRLELEEALLKATENALARKEYLARMLETPNSFKMRTLFKRVKTPAQEEKILELKDRVEAVDTAKLPEEPLFSAPSEIQELVQVIQSGIAEAPSVVDQVATLLTI
jgi:hypothetical protein